MADDSSRRRREPAEGPDRRFGALQLRSHAEEHRVITARDVCQCGNQFSFPNAVANSDSPGPSTWLVADNDFELSTGAVGL
jgi:hypothetical protein